MFLYGFFALFSKKFFLNSLNEGNDSPLFTSWISLSILSSFFPYSLVTINGITKRGIKPVARKIRENSKGMHPSKVNVRRVKYHTITKLKRKET
jgi:hypothetical protein